MHVRSFASLLIVFVLGPLSACASTEIDASNYRRDCAVDADCAIVFEGDVCRCFGARVPAAIRVSALAEFDADSNALFEGCHGPVAHCAPAPSFTARGSAGACGVTP